MYKDWEKSKIQMHREMPWYDAVDILRDFFEIYNTLRPIDVNKQLKKVMMRHKRNYQPFSQTSRFPERTFITEANPFWAKHFSALRKFLREPENLKSDSSVYDVVAAIIDGLNENKNNMTREKFESEYKLKWTL